MRVVDLFSGCGGLSKGFELAGLELTLAVERWEAALNVYRNNFEHPAQALDLSNVRDAVQTISKERPDIIVGGPPCQEFSVAGGRVEGARAELTVSFANIVHRVQPRWFVLENVPGARGSDAWARGRAILERSGYGITECVLDASFFGVPQKRKRFFAIGRYEEADGFLHDQIEFGRAQEPLSVREFVGDEFGIDYYYRHPRNWGRRGVFSLDEPSPTVRSTNRPVPPGYKPHKDDAGPSNQARPLSSVERARVQTFDRDFVFRGSLTDQDMMIANAVPVILARHIANAVRIHEEERQMTGDESFRAWLRTTQAYTPRTAGNVVSRLRRASRMLDPKRLSNDPLDAIHALERRKEFVTLSSSVRSQIKKAIRLHAEFNQQ